MSTTQTEAPLRGPSLPAQLAHLALEAAIATRGVAGPVAGVAGRWSTPDRGGRVDGVVVAAERDGRFAVELHLAVYPVALGPLAERVRARVHEVTSTAGLADALGAIGVHFDDLAEPTPEVGG